MKKIIGVLLFGISASSFASVGDVPPQTATDCSLLKGSVVTLTPAYFTGDEKITRGISKEFCVVSNKLTLSIFDLNTISNKPSIAATYIKSAKIVLSEGGILPTKPYSNPSVNICKAMGGSAVEYTDPKTQMNGYIGPVIPNQPDYQDICTFGDGSAVSGWTLTYAALINGGSPDENHQYIIDSIKSNPLPIFVPNLKYK